MKKINLLLSIVLVSLWCHTNAQELTKKEKKEFKPSGKPFAKVFSNFHTDFHSSAFQITRAYLGYKYKISENFSTKITLDVGNPKNGSALEQTVFLKIAAVTYKKDNLAIDFGLIGLKQFKIQEEFWGHRYLYKSLQDNHKLGSSADLGASISYKFHEKVSVDFTVMNGEGYKKLQADDTYKSGLGITLKPMEDLTFRAYYDFTQKSETQSTIALFAGYKPVHNLSIGAEFNTQMNNKYLDQHNLFGVSAYASYDISKKFQLFARYDDVSSNTLTEAGETVPWDLDKDGSAIIGGVQFAPVKGVKMAVNYQGWNYDMPDVDTENQLYLSFEYKF